MSEMEAPRLPRGIAEEPGAERLPAEIVSRSRPLWQRSELRVADAALGLSVAAALQSAFSAGRIVRGLEGAQQALAAEQRGLAQVDRKTGVERGGRVSRLLLLTRDGSERFYREVEALLHQHAPRVLALRLDADELTLGRLLYGEAARARLLMVAHKDAVSAVLLAVADQWSLRG